MVFGIKSSNPLKAPQDVSRQYMTFLYSTQKKSNDTASVIKVKETLVRHFLNPFACKSKTDLFNIAAGQKSKSVDLLNAKTI